MRDEESERGVCEIITELGGDLGVSYGGFGGVGIRQAHPNASRRGGDVSLERRNHCGVSTEHE